MFNSLLHTKQQTPVPYPSSLTMGYLVTEHHYFQDKTSPNNELSNMIMVVTLYCSGLPLT